MKSKKKKKKTASSEVKTKIFALNGLIKKMNYRIIEFNIFNQNHKNY